MIENQQIREKRFNYSYYFRQVHSSVIDDFIQLVEKVLCDSFCLWPSVEISHEGYTISYPIITAWKAAQKDTRIVFIEDQSYKYGSKVIALFSCSEMEKIQLEELFREIEKKISKVHISSEKVLADKNTVAWLKEHKFIFTLLGFAGISGTSLYLRFFSISETSRSPTNLFDVLILVLGKIVAIIIMGAAACFLVIVFFRIIRILFGRKIS